jgi:hypothetical protein
MPGSVAGGTLCIRKTFQCKQQRSIYWGRREFSLHHTIQERNILLHLEASKLHLLQAVKLSYRCYRYKFCEVSSLLGCYLAPQVRTILTSHCTVPPGFHLTVQESLNNAVPQQWATCGAKVDNRWLSWPCRAVQLLSVCHMLGAVFVLPLPTDITELRWKDHRNTYIKWPGTHWRRSGTKLNMDQTCAIWHGLVLSACRAEWELQKCLCWSVCICPMNNKWQF